MLGANDADVLGRRRTAGHQCSVPAAKALSGEGTVVRFLDRLRDCSEVGRDPRRGRRLEPPAGFGEHDVDDRRGDALDERRRHALGAQQEASKRGIVVRHRLGAMLDSRLCPRRADNGRCVQREVALGEAAGHERPDAPPSPHDGDLNPCRLHAPPFVRLRPQVYVIAGRTPSRDRHFGSSQAASSDDGLRRRTYQTSLIFCVGWQ